MRAANGAIERLRLSDGHIEYQTIGGAPPVGLCGSGILDVLAQLVVAGVVDANGRMGEHPRVRAIDGDPSRHGTREFVLVSEEEQRGEHPAITFTQKDVRELQLAKGAMRTGIETLLATSGLNAQDIDQVIIAGHTHRSWHPVAGDPPYFNDGSCVHPRWITCIEIKEGTITLVRWRIQPDSKGRLVIKRKELKGPKDLKDFAN